MLTVSAAQLSNRGLQLWNISTGCIEGGCFANFIYEIIA